MRGGLRRHRRGAAAWRRVRPDDRDRGRDAARDRLDRARRPAARAAPGRGQSARGDRRTHGDRRRAARQQRRRGAGGAAGARRGRRQHPDLLDQHRHRPPAGEECQPIASFKATKRLLVDYVVRVEVGTWARRTACWAARSSSPPDRSTSRRRWPAARSPRWRWRGRGARRGGAHLRAPHSHPASAHADRGGAGGGGRRPDQGASRRCSNSTPSCRSPRIRRWRRAASASWSCSRGTWPSSACGREICGRPGRRDPATRAALARAAARDARPLVAIVRGGPATSSACEAVGARQGALQARADG